MCDCGQSGTPSLEVTLPNDSPPTTDAIRHTVCPTFQPVVATLSSSLYRSRNCESECYKHKKNRQRSNTALNFVGINISLRSFIFYCIVTFKTVCSHCSGGFVKRLAVYGKC